MVKEVIWLNREPAEPDNLIHHPGKLDGVLVGSLSLLAVQPSSPSSKLDGVA